MKEIIRQELVEFVGRELRECREFARTKEDVLRARDRAFGAVVFVFCLDSSLYREMCEWWNYSMLPQFNSLHDRL